LLSISILVQTSELVFELDVDQILKIPVPLELSFDKNILLAFVELFKSVVPKISVDRPLKFPVTNTLPLLSTSIHPD
jgi:hypothetical protein